MDLFRHHARSSRRAFLAGLAGLPALGLAPARVPGGPLPDPSSWSDGTITASWLGHSTVLLNMFGTWVLTDPVFTGQVGINVLGLFVIGPQRITPSALGIEHLPPIDLVLISHAHMDHMDLRTLEALDRRATIVVPAGTADLVEDLGFAEVRELDWGETATLHGVTLEGIEVNHIGWRFPWEPDRSRGFEEGRSYNAYLLSRNGRHVVFAGDTAYTETFRPIGERFPQIDLAIMPIGGYEPWEQNHATPEQAVRMANDLNARYILPVHWLTFLSPSEVPMEPIERLREALADEPSRIALDGLGQSWTLPADGTEGPSQR